MLKASDVMTRALATCAPDASVAHVAGVMRDRDIGDLLVVEDGKLRGIVTDRDLALKALTGDDDPLQTPVKKFMSREVVTGRATWSLEQVAKSMGRHQVRRLPIVRDGQLVGIVSLGDMARNDARKGFASKSLQAISTPIGISARERSGGGAWIGLALAALAATAMAWLTWNNAGQVLRRRMAGSEFYLAAEKAVQGARGRMEEGTSHTVYLDR